MKIPGPGPLQFINGIRTLGFLELVGQLWREHGDLFQVRLGRRTLVFAMHPDVVERVNVSQRQNYDKVASYDAVPASGEVVSSGIAPRGRGPRHGVLPSFATDDPVAICPSAALQRTH